MNLYNSKICAKHYIVLISFFILITYSVSKGHGKLEQDDFMFRSHSQSRPVQTNDELNRIPNIILIFIENIVNLQRMFVKNYTRMNGSTINLRNMEKIRNQSYLFDHVMSEMHSSSSSATLLTGLPAVHTGMIKGKILPFTEIPSVASTGGLQYEHAILAESIKQVTRGIANYVTAFVGYWKLGHGKGGRYLPHKRGFDFWTGIPFKHTSNCHERKISSWTYGRKERAISHQYINLMYLTFPGWLVALIGIFSAYFLKAISWKGLVNALIYMFLFSLVCFLFLKVFIAHRNASCLLYHMNEIIEQPYDIENMTLFFTQSVIHVLEAFHVQSKPFFLHLNYLKLQEPSFSSSYFKKGSNFDSLLELDWSIGQIMTAMEELNLIDNTMVILTGSNDCKQYVESLKQNSFKQKIPTKKRGKQSFILANVSDWLGECLQVPLYLRYDDIKQEKKVISTPVSFMDVAPTILEAITNVTQDDYPGCSLLPLIFDDNNTPQLPIVYNLIQTGLVNEQHQHTHRCNPFNRLHMHYVDITKPLAVTIGNTFRLVFSNINGKNSITNLEYPMIYSFKITMQLFNVSEKYLQELYINVTKEIENHEIKRKNKWSSQFEMPVYPWLLPCANFPKCRVKNGVLSDFSTLELLENSTQLDPEFEKRYPAEI